MLRQSLRSSTSPNRPPSPLSDIGLRLRSSAAGDQGSGSDVGSADDERFELRQSLRSLASSSRHSSPPSFSTWDEVPDVLTAAHKLRPWFVEIFAGKARFTRAMKKAGWSTLPPVEINVEGDNLALRRKIEAWIASVCVRLAHFGTPCTTFSKTRKHDGGPPLVRTRRFLNGVPFLSAKNKEKVRLGTLFLDITLQLCEALTKAGAFLVYRESGVIDALVDATVEGFLPPVLAFTHRAPHVCLRFSSCQADLVPHDSRSCPVSDR